MKPFFTRLLDVKSFCRIFSAIGLLLTGLFFSGNIQAQLTPANCTQGCTSNDVRIIAAYLSDTNGVKLPSSFTCPNSGVAHVFLTLELTTKTPRVGVTIYTNIRPLPLPSTTILATFGQCFSKALNQPTNKVTFSNAFNWTCGQSIALTDVFIGWGTGNTDFCAGLSAFRCPATPSKCYQLPIDSAIAIQAPTANTASATLCSDTAGGTYATFNLTSLNSTVIGSQSNVTVTWFTDNPPTNQINTPGAYTAPSGAVYAKVASNSDPTSYSIATVTLTVHSLPVKPGVCITQPSLCGPTTGSVTFTSPIGTGFQYSIDNGATWEDSSTTINNLAAGSVSGFKVKKDGCISAAADCSESSCTTAPQQTISRTQINTISISDEQTTVKAYPNPFNDKVKFVINSSLSGRGSLEIFNMMGQKVKTVYQGRISSGVNHFDLSLPNQKFSNLVYKFVLGGKQVTGKLLQISQ
jgi:hypothetical protein